MDKLTRRSVLRASAAAVALGTFAQPYIANAAAKTASLWIAQGFVPEEDIAAKKLIADYEKESGNKINLSIAPFGPLRDKEVAAVTSGNVPDVMEWANHNFATLQSWAGRLENVSAIIDTQKSQFTETALVSAYLYNNVEKNRAYYGVPWKLGSEAFHIWISLVEKAGYKLSEIPDRWSAFIDFFKPMQKKLRAQGMRHTYSYAFQVATIGVGSLNNFNAFMIAYGGKGIFTPDGKFHGSEPHIKEAVMKAMNQLASLLKDGYIPASAVGWNDSGDNNAFHAKLCVLDFGGTISIELAVIHNKEEYDDILTHGLPNDDQGKPIPAQIEAYGCVIPKGAKHPEVAREFLEYAIRPKVLSEYLKGSLGRWAIPMAKFAANDPFWAHNSDPHLKAYFHETLFGPTMPSFEAFNPAIGQIDAEHVFQVGIADIARHGMAPEVATDKALKRIGEIFKKYPIEAA